MLKTIKTIFKRKQLIILAPIVLIILLTGIYFSWQNIALNQIKSLIADENYNVAVLEECDLAVRFKKVFRIGNDNFFTELFGKYGQDYIQIQFNSLAPSTPSVKI